MVLPDDLGRLRVARNSRKTLRDVLVSACSAVSLDVADMRAKDELGEVCQSLEGGGGRREREMEEREKEEDEE